MPQYVTESTADPSAAPSRIGYVWVNTSAATVFLSTGTAAVGDWKKMDVAATGNFSGSGTPEGVVTASPGATYTDVADPPLFWVKITGAGNTGWRQLIG